MMISFVILEIYFFIILIADVLFIYLICIREPENRKLYRLGLLFVGWIGAFTCDLRLLCVLYICLNQFTWDKAVPAFKQGMPFRNLYILQLPKQ